MRFNPFVWLLQIMLGVEADGIMGKDTQRALKRFIEGFRL